MSEQIDHYAEALRYIQNEWAGNDAILIAHAILSLRQPSEAELAAALAEDYDEEPELKIVTETRPGVESFGRP
jgi:hypothetical protein